MFLPAPLMSPPVPGRPSVVNSALNAANPDTSVDLTWTDIKPFTAKWWLIQKAVDSGGSPGSWSTVESEWEGGSPYTVTGLNSNTKYWFRVSARNRLGNSIIRRTSSYITTEYSEIVDTPTLTVQDKATDDTSLQVSWSAVAEAVEYDVYYGTSPGVANTFYFTTGSTGFESNLGQPTGQYMCFKVRGVNPDSDGPFSNVVGDTTTPVTPDAPSSVTNTLSGSDIEVEWYDASENETQFYVYRRSRVVGGSWGSYSELAPTSPVATSDKAGNGYQSITDTTVSEGYEYQYGVAASNVTEGGGTSSTTYAASGEVVPVPTSAPTWTSTYPKKDPATPTDNVDLSWAVGATGTTDDIDIHRSASSSFTPGAGTLIYTVTDPGVTTTYDDDGIGSGGTVDAPTVTPTGDAEMNIDWADVTDASNYKLYRGSTSGFTPNDGTNLIYTGATSSYDDSGLSENTTYFYKVVAYFSTSPWYYKLVARNDYGASATSAQGSVTLDSYWGSASSAGSGTTYYQVPQSFNVSPGGASTTSCSWSNAGREETKTIEIYDYNIADWANVDAAVGAALENYSGIAFDADNISGGDIYLRIKYNTESVWAYDYGTVPT